VRAYEAIPPGAPIRLAKSTSNLFRTRRLADRPGLDVTGLDEVLHVDPQAGTAVVEAMTTYEKLVDVTLAHGVMPKVVPQLKTITIGGAATGIGIESSSFRHGLVHESVRELEILTGDGRVVVATPDNEHRDLFFGFPNSYGTLGYALRLEIEVMAVQPYVELRHMRFADSSALFCAIDEICGAGAWFGVPIDFVDAAVYAEDEQVLTIGRFVSEAPYHSDYRAMAIYYESTRRRSLDYLRTADYLWRWDTDWFWCSRNFGVQSPLVRAMVPPRLLRSSVYWKLLTTVQSRGLDRRFDRIRGLGRREMIVQDVEIPIRSAAAFLDFFHREIGILPIWICPTRQADPTAHWDLYAMDPAALYVNFGFWSSRMLDAGTEDGTFNRLIEAKVAELGGRKSLYSTSFYGERDFWNTYGGDAYHALKKTYDPDGRLLDLYEKCVGAG